MPTLADEKSLILMTLAVYLGATFAGLFKSIVNDFVMPLLSFVLPVDNMGRIMMKVNGKLYDVGHAVVELIHALLAVILVALTLWMFDSYGTTVFTAPISIMAGGRR